MLLRDGAGLGWVVLETSSCSFRRRRVGGFSAVRGLHESRAMTGVLEERTWSEIGIRRDDDPGGNLIHLSVRTGRELQGQLETIETKSRDPVSSGRIFRVDATPELLPPGAS